MTKRNRWYKKQLRIISRSYRICKTVYISKKRRAENRAWHLEMAKAIFEAPVLSIEKGPPVSLFDLLNYTTGKQTNPIKKTT